MKRSFARTGLPLRPLRKSQFNSKIKQIILEILQKTDDYRVSQKFVPLISYAITFHQNFVFTRNFLKMFIALSSACMQNFSDWHDPFAFLSHSVAVAAWSGIQRKGPQMIQF